MLAVKYLHCVEKEFSGDLVLYLTTFLQVHVSDPPFLRSNQENLQTYRILSENFHIQAWVVHALGECPSFYCEVQGIVHIC